MESSYVPSRAVRRVTCRAGEERPCEDTAGRQPSQAKERSLRRDQPARALNFQPPELGDDKCQFSKPRSV